MFSSLNTTWQRVSDWRPAVWREAERSNWRWREWRTAEASPQTRLAATVRSAQLARVEAVLFVADAPLSLKKIFDAAKLAELDQCRLLIDELNACYDAEDSPFRVEQVASGFQLLTRPKYAYWLDRVHQRNVELKLTPPALETLTIIAYRQPITRADVEAIRGVQCSDVIKQLMERQLIRIGGEDDSLGRPYLYETTRQFLQYLGLRRIDQLPNYQELRPEKKQTPTETDEQAADSAADKRAA